MRTGNGYLKNWIIFGEEELFYCVGILLTEKFDTGSYGGCGNRLWNIIRMMCCISVDWVPYNTLKEQQLAFSLVYLFEGLFCASVQELVIG